MALPDHKVTSFTFLHEAQQDRPSFSSSLEFKQAIDSQAKQIQTGLNGLIDELNSSAQAPDFMARQSLINGNFDIWQRGTTFNNVATGAYTADRWKTTNAVDSNVKVSRSTDVPNKKSKFSMRVEQMTATGGVNANTDIFQLIEDYQFLQGQEVTFSGWVKADAGVTVTPSMDDSVGSTAGIAITGNVWTFFEVKRTIDNGATQVFPRLRVNRNALAIGLGAYFAQLQVNFGDVALPFHPRNFAEELSMCQRYYEKSYGYNVAPANPNDSGGAQTIIVPSNTVTAGQRYGTIKYSSRKRITPTITIYPFTTPTNTGRVSSDAGTDLAASSGGVGWQNDTSFVVYNNSGASLTTSNNTLLFHYACDAEM